MQIAVKVIELAGPFQIPAGLENYDGARIYYSVRGQIKGFTTLWNNHKTLASLKSFRYPADYGSWLMLFEAFFSEAGRTKAYPPLIKALFCALIDLDTTNLNLEEAYLPPVPDLPPLSASIVIPTKDRPDDLGRALHQLTQHQTRVPHEIIVVDNNPTTGLTRPIVQKFPQVIYVAEARPGVGYARNAGTLVARGDIVVSTDDDVVVDKGWLDQMIAPFADPQVGAVMGLVLPYEISSRSQELFEGMGGLNLGYERQNFGPDFFQQPNFPEMGKVGNTSSAAFRYSLFADPRVGPFEVALGSGTKARGGGDVYQFYRVLAAGFTSVYTPQGRAFHKHRSSMPKLRKQLFSFACGYSAMIARAGSRDKDRRAYRLLTYYLPRYQLQRLGQALAKPNLALAYLSLLQTVGSLIGPLNLWRSLRHSRRFGDYRAEDFAQAQTRREPLGAQISSKVLQAT